jgi:hypothetical protein
LKTAYWAGLAIGFFLGLIYLFQSYYADSMTLISNIVAPLMAGSAVVSAVFAFKKYSKTFESWFFIIWLCFTLGMLLWFLREITWAIYVLILNVKTPYPSIADAFWLSGYVPLLTAIYFYVRHFRHPLFKKMYILCVAIDTAVSILLFAILVPPIIAAYKNPLTLILSIAYPALDLILFSEAILGLLTFTVTMLKGWITKAWLLINAGIVMKVIGDLLFGYTNSQNIYFNGHPLELFFYWGYILFALAFYTYMKES